MPIDPVSDGTWIAASDAGLTLVLLNHNPPSKKARTRPPESSRGTIIPALLSSATLDEALNRSKRMDLARFDPFRLLLLDATHGWEQRWDPQGGHEVRRFDIRGGPMLFASSGLGDDLVEPPRKALFNEWFSSGEPTPARQDAFHRHAWPDRRHLSVCMWRPEALTVSYTAIEWSAERVRMSYHPGPPDAPANSEVVDLVVRAAAQP